MLSNIYKLDFITGDVCLAPVVAQTMKSQLFPTCVIIATPIDYYEVAKNKKDGLNKLST